MSVIPNVYACNYPKLNTRMYHNVDKYNILFVGHYFLH